MEAKVDGCAPDIYKRVPDGLSQTPCIGERGFEINELETIALELKAIYNRLTVHRNTPDDEIKADLRYSKDAQRLCMFYMLYDIKRGIDTADCRAKYSEIWDFNVRLDTGIDATSRMKENVRFRGQIKAAVIYILYHIGKSASKVDLPTIQLADNLTWWKNWYAIHDIIRGHKNSETFGVKQQEFEKMRNASEQARRRLEAMREKQKKANQQHAISKMKQYNTNTSNLSSQSSQSSRRSSHDINHVSGTGSGTDSGTDSNISPIQISHFLEPPIDPKPILVKPKGKPAGKIKPRQVTISEGVSFGGNVAAEARATNQKNNPIRQTLINIASGGLRKRRTRKQYKRKHRTRKH